jgi:hypothetical protein
MPSAFSSIFSLRAFILHIGLIFHILEYLFEFLSLIYCKSIAYFLAHIRIPILNRQTSGEAQEGRLIIENINFL